MQNGVVESFIKSYEKEYDYYDTLSRIAAQKIDTLLRHAGVRAIVTNRAKDPERLRAKLIKRETDNKTPYSSADEINSDIWDLAGVRIALYFPSDREKADNIIKSAFDLITDIKKFPNSDSDSSLPPYPKRFSGYWANHYRVRFKSESLSSDQSRYSQARIEIQVASVLMHAWSEVEHDLVYKPLNGELSEEEYSILDELNGLVMAGEIALERLQAAGNARITKNKENIFNNQYEVASYLYSKYQARAKNGGELILGNIDLLYKFMRECQIKSPSDLLPFLKNISLQNNAKSGNTISAQIIDNIISGDEEKYNIFSELRQSQDPIGEEVSTAIGDFISEWIHLEQLLSVISGLDKSKPLNANRLKQFINPRDMQLLLEIKSFRNAVVHGEKKPTLIELNEMIDKTTRLYQTIESKINR